MPSSSGEAIFQSTGRRRWANWHDTFDQSVNELIDVWNADPNSSTIEGYNATTKGFQHVIARALRDNLTVRALGGGWSWSDVARADGILLNTRPLNYRFQIRDVHLRQHDLRAENLSFVQCGISIADLNRHLNSLQPPKSIKTSGASNGQTIAGALSTGTHGAAIRVGAVPDFVLGLHIIVSPEKSIWLEPASRPVVVDNFSAALGAEMVRDDDLFKAALVSFGSFGIIHGVLIEADDLFFLHASRQRMPLDEGMWTALEALDFSDVNLPPRDENGLTRASRRGAEPFHFQVVMNPFDMEDGIFATVMYKDAERKSDCNPPRESGGLAPGDGALEVVSVITDIAPGLTPVLAGNLVRSAYSEYEGRCGTHGEIFSDTTTRGKTASMAMGIPLGRVRESVEIALAAIRHHGAPALVALRYVRGSEATLAFTSHKPQTCVLEVDGPRSNRVRNAYKRIWRELDNAGVPYTFHWGKLNNLDAERVRRIYGEEKVHAWRNARRQILDTPELRQVFANGFLKSLDLDD